MAEHLHNLLLLMLLTVSPCELHQKLDETGIMQHSFWPLMPVYVL